MAHYDKNGDSKLNPVELQAVRVATIRSRPGSRSGIEEFLTLQPPLTRPFDSRFDVPMLLNRYDANRDSALDVTELVGPAMELWCLGEP